MPHPRKPMIAGSCDSVTAKLSYKDSIVSVINRVILLLYIGFCAKAEILSVAKNFFFLHLLRKSPKLDSLFSPNQL